MSLASQTDTRKCKYTIRAMQDGDDYFQVARLIYLSDRYIYPNWFDSIEDGKKVIAAMIKLPTLYNQKNITVAVAQDGYIIGAMVSRESPVVEDEDIVREAFRRAKVVCDARTHDIFLDYYDKMKEDTQGYYIANITVDPQYRRQGVAASLMSHVIKGRPLCHLECVKANEGAWKIYQRLGFEIVGEYPGVFGVPCYKMIRRER
ncbi:MAG: GNAT family N-acetyltransferase [Christensenellales bacterium]